MPEGPRPHCAGSFSPGRRLPCQADPSRRPLTATALQQAAATRTPRASLPESLGLRHSTNPSPSDGTRACPHARRARRAGVSKARLRGRLLQVSPSKGANSSTGNKRASSSPSDSLFCPSRWVCAVELGRVCSFALSSPAQILACR